MHLSESSTSFTSVFYSHNRVTREFILVITLSNMIDNKYALWLQHNLPPVKHYTEYIYLPDPRSLYLNDLNAPKIHLE